MDLEKYTESYKYTRQHDYSAEGASTNVLNSIFGSSVTTR